MADCGDCDDVAVGALPLAMTPQQSQEMVGTDVNVANVTLNASMKPMLERFCDATKNPSEKAKALELLTALELSDAIKAEATDGRPRAMTPGSSDGGRHHHDGGGRRRPRTAAPRLLQQQLQQQRQQLQSPAPSDCDTSGIASGGGGGGLSYVNSYETTHNYYYPPPAPSPVRAVRPASSQIQRVVPPPNELAPGNSFTDLFQTTTYGREFFAKSDAARRSVPERAASARGVRNNNPHPNQEFMVWRYRRPMTATVKIEEAATADSESSPQPQEMHEQQMGQPQLTNETFDRAVRGKCRSTYQHDYLGVPTSFDVNQRAIALLAVDGRPAPAYDRASMSRVAFAKPPRVPPELEVAKARFGHNPARAHPGVIPAGGLSGQAFGARTRTTYDAHISEPGSRLMRVADLRQYSNAQNAQAVGRMLDGASGSERAALMKLYREMQSRQLPVSIPLPVERRIYKERVGGHMRVGGQPAYQSTWAGPGAY